MTDREICVSLDSDEILTDVIDSQTGEIYRENMLHASAYMWAVRNKWKIILEEIDHLRADQYEPARTIRWLYVEQTPDSMWNDLELLRRSR